MKDQRMTKEELLKELDALRRRLAELEAAEAKHERAEKEIAEAEEQLTIFKTVTDRANSGIALAGLDGKIVYVNEHFAAMHGYDPQELIGRNMSLFHTGQSRQGLQEIIKQLRELGGHGAVELWQKRKDGSAFPVLMNGVIVRDALGKPAFVASIAIDISRRFRAEEALREARAELETRVRERTAELTKANEALLAEIAERKRAQEREGLLNRMLYTLSDINQMIVRESNQDHLLAETCRIIVERGGFRMAWVGMADFPSGKVVPVAQAGVEKEFIEGLGIRCDDTPGGRLPAGIAIRTGRRLVCPDIERDETFAPWREAAGLHGCCAAAAFPLRVRGRVVGSITVLAAEASAVGEEMISLLDELAGDIAYALHNLGEVAIRKQAEEVIREGRARLQELFDRAPVGYHELDTQGRIRQVNQTELAMLGYAAEEMLGRPVWEFVEDKERSRLATLSKVTGTLPAGSQFERSYRRKDGTALPVLIEDRLLKDASGRITGIRSTLQDITGRKREEAALRESEEKYRVLVQQLPDGICIHQNGRIVFSNEAHWQMLGFESGQEILGADGYEFIAPESQGLVHERVQKRMQGAEAPQRYEIKSRRRDGSVFDSEVVAVPVTFNGQPAIQVALRDITERKRAEERIGLLNRLLRTIAEINQVMVRENDRDRLLAETCRILVELGGFCAAWVGLANFETGEVLPAAQAGFKGDFLGAARVRCDDTPRGRGPTGTAIRTGKPVICNDLETDPTTAPWRDITRQQGFRATAALPLAIRGRVIGVILVYAAERGAIGGEMVALLEELAGDISFALQAIDEAAQRKQAEDALRLTQFSVDHAADAVFWIAPDARILYANEAACRALGYSREQLLSMTVYDIDLNFQANNWPQHWAELKERRHFTFESHQRTSDGRIFPVEITINYLEFGGQEYNFAFVRNITARKQAEAALRLKEARLDALLRLSHMAEAPLKDLADFAMEEAVRLTDSTIGYLAFLDESESVLTMHSWSKNAMRKCAISDKPIVYPLATTGLWGEAVRQRRPVITNDYTAPNPLKKGYPHGHVPVFRHMNVPVFDDGRIVAVAGVGNKEEEYDESDVRQLTLLMEGMWTIVQRKRSAEALRERNETLRTLIHASPVAILSLDTAGHITSWNAAAERIFGWKAEEVIGKPNPIIPPGRQDEVLRLRERRLRGESLTDIRVRRVRKDGSPIDLSLSSAPVRDKDGKITGFLTLLTDITEQRRMEEEVLRARKIESVGVLAGGIAHDFNNLLSVILGNISLARTRLATSAGQGAGRPATGSPAGGLAAREPCAALDDKARILEKLAEAEKACFRSRELTHQLLTFSRGGAPVKKTASMAELLKESVRFALRGSNVGCEFLLPEGLWPVEMDEGQIGQVISNLVINADQAMPDGGVIRVRAENITVDATASSIVAQHALSLPEGRYVKVSIQDHGVGIPKENLQKIFDPYFTTKPGGTGLGLSTAYSIIRKHGGHITLESSAGAGTTAIFCLSASEKDILPRQPSTSTPIAGRGRILVMDDEEMIRGLAEAMLTQLGYEVFLAKDGAEAVTAYHRAKQSGAAFDAVIVDLTVPGGMGGKEAVKRLLELDPQARAIVSSGYSDDPVMSEFRQYGFRGVIAKPYKIEDLSGILHRVLRGQGA